MAMVVVVFVEKVMVDAVFVVILMVMLKDLIEMMASDG